MKPGDKVYVIDWGKRYSDVTKWNYTLQRRENVFPFKTIIPDCSDIEHHWKFEYEPNLTLKGTVNKREPTKLKSKTPVYKEYKYEVREIIKHPKAGEFYYPEEKRKDWGYDKYPETDILLISSTHTDIEPLKCFVVIGEEGVSLLTPQEFADKEFNALINYHKGRWTKDMLTREVKDRLPPEIITTAYDPNDDVLFGSSITKGKIAYNYLDGKFTKDGIPLYISSSCTYDGIGNTDLPPGTIFKTYREMVAMLPHNR